MIQRKSSIISLVLAAGVFLWAASAWAACVQKDLKGTWSTKVCGGVFGSEECWDECTLSIGSDGSIKSKGTYTDCCGVSSSIIGGQLTISDGCQIEGTIKTGRRTFYIDRGGIVEDELVLGKTSDARWIRLRLKTALETQDMPQ